VKQLVEVRLTPNARPEEAHATAAAATAAAVADADTHTVQDAARGGPEDPARFQCPSCLRAITFQKVFLLKLCGHTCCDKCTAQFIVPSKRCLVCNQAVRSFMIDCCCIARCAMSLLHFYNRRCRKGMLLRYNKVALPTLGTQGLR
jgi:hypothetical protein